MPQCSRSPPRQKVIKCRECTTVILKQTSNFASFRHKVYCSTHQHWSNWELLRLWPCPSAWDSNTGITHVCAGPWPIRDKTISHDTLLIYLNTCPCHSETVCMLVTISSNYPKVLGLCWLQTNNPQISWIEQKILTLLQILYLSLCNYHNMHSQWRSCGWNSWQKSWPHPHIILHFF